MDDNVKLIVQIITIVGSVAGSFTAIVGAFWWILKWYNKSLLKDLELLKNERDSLLKDIAKTASANTHITEQHQEAKEEIKELRQAVHRSQETERGLGENLDALQSERAKEFAQYDGYREKWRQTHEKLNDEIVALKTELTTKSHSHNHLQIIRERIKTISSLDGKLWNRPVLADAPAYIPRKTRATRIISILNLKGGVGKTTVTANLGAALADSGRVLMVDLDFQRSLSRLTLSDKDRTLRHYQKRCVQHFLSGATHDIATFMEMVGDPIDEPANCWFLPNSDSVRDHSSDSENVSCEDDSLEETEMRLMFDWIFDPNPKDIRFHLREALHNQHQDDYFKYILLDCPPRLTTACINALAASDYVLIPVTLDAMATNSVPYLLKTLDILKNVLPQLEILGVVANKVNMSGANLVSQERTAWENLQNQCRSVDFFTTKIKEDSAIGKFATQSIEEDKRTLRQAKPYEKTRKCFDDLADEVVKKIATKEKQALAPVVA